MIDIVNKSIQISERRNKYGYEIKNLHKKNYLSFTQFSDIMLMVFYTLFTKGENQMKKKLIKF